MKKFSLILVLMTVILLAVSPAPVIAAQKLAPTRTPTRTATKPVPTPIPTPVATKPAPTPTPVDLKPTQTPLLQGADVYTFSSLGMIDSVMYGPFDSMSVHFSLPNNWALNSRATVQLHIKNIFPNLTGLSEKELIQAIGATVDIEFNGVWLTTLVLDWSGERTITIPITANTLKTTISGQHYLALYLNAGIDCKFNHQTTVAVFSDSRLDLQHDITTPTIDLVQLPVPIYQENSLLLNNITRDSSTYPITAMDTVAPAALITSDNPTAAEMQAALIVSAGFGRLTGGNLPLTTLPAGELTDQIKQSSHLIFVGKGEGFTALNGIALPVVYDGQNFKTPNAKPEDGLIQEAVSPWDPSKVILVVSSESDVGILKAAQAISSGIIRVGDRSDLAVVSEVTPGKVVTSIPDDRTLADLGFETIQLNGVGYKTQDYFFLMPTGQILRKPAYFKVMFTNSTFLNVDQSGMSILLNGQSIGGIRYTTESAKSVTTEEINISGYLLRPGTNRLTIQAEHIPLTYCSDIVLKNLWTNIPNQSILHIPLTPAKADIVNQITLANYTDFISTSPTLASTAFVVAQNSPTAFKIASQIAYQLGSLMTGSLVELKAAYAGQIPAEFRKNYELVLVGKASQLPIIAELGNSLPAPFDNGSDVAQETVFEVIYRIPPNISIGYLELLSAPWDSARNILAVLGSTDEGLSYSANALTVRAIQNKLSGNFAAVRNEQVISGDTRMGIGTGNISATLLPGIAQTTQIPTTKSTIAPTESLPLENQTKWILPAVGLLSLLIILILLVAFFTSRRKQ